MHTISKHQAQEVLNQSMVLLSDNGTITVLGQAKFYPIKPSQLAPRGFINLVRLDFEVTKGVWWGGAETTAIAAVSAYSGVPLESLKTSRSKDHKVVSVSFEEEK